MKSLISNDPAALQNPKMVSQDGPRQGGGGAQRPIVAFDFDGTLTHRDSFTALLEWRTGPVGFTVRCLGLAPAAAAYLVHPDRGRLKAALVHRFLGHRDVAEVEASAMQFAESHARRLLRPDAMRIWKCWQSRGARMIIVTASPEIVIAPFARGLGADLLLGTRLEADAAERLTGRLDGENCRGPEKVRRLREALGEDMQLAAAYGDTDGDREMLAIADEAGFRVFTGKP